MTGHAGEQLAEAALRYAGVPFRLGGRSREGGVDCVGLLLCALRDIGQSPPAPPPYRLRNIAVERHLACLPQAGFVPVQEPVRPGDVLVVRPGPAQHHLLIATGPGCVHAHAGLCRVTEEPVVPLWPVESQWRLCLQTGVPEPWPH